MELIPLLNPLQSNIFTEQDIDQCVETLTRSMINAAAKAVPTVIMKPNRPRPWSASIKRAIQSSKEALHQWQLADKPGTDHAVSARRRTARKLVRRAFRVQTAKVRRNLLEKLMDSHSNKDKLFYKLVDRQRSSSKSHTMALSIKGRIITDTDELGEAWADYFYTLGTPSCDPTFDDSRKKRVEYDQNIIHDYLSKRKPNTPVTIPEITEAIKRLNTGKAPDPTGLRAEHFCKAANIVAPYLSHLYTAMLKLTHIPANLQTGIMVPIPKKGKDHLQPSNYRGITLTAMLIKLLEHIILSREEHHILAAQNPLQIGFTRGSSPAWGSLMLTEAITESISNKTPLYTAALDVQNTEWHDSLLRKLFLSGIKDSWMIREAMIRNLSISV